MVKRKALYGVIIPATSPPEYSGLQELKIASDDEIEGHPSNLMFGGANRLLVGQGSPGGQDDPVPVLLSNGNAIARPANGNPVTSMNGKTFRTEVLEITDGVAATAPSAPVQQGGLHFEREVPASEAYGNLWYYYDYLRLKWLGVDLFTLDFYSPTAVTDGYLLDAYGQTTSATEGYYVNFPFTVVGFEGWCDPLDAGAANNQLQLRDDGETNPLNMAKHTMGANTQIGVYLKGVGLSPMSDDYDGGQAYSCFSAFESGNRIRCRWYCRRRLD